MTKDEPVAYFNPQEGGFYWAKPTKVEAPITIDVEPLPLYTKPQTKGCDECGNGGGYALYCLPCAEKFFGNKEWLGLTSEDIYACDEQSKLPKYEITNADLQAFAYAIEAKLKEKNNG
jgi:hypothetical protein